MAFDKDLFSGSDHVDYCEYVYEYLFGSSDNPKTRLPENITAFDIQCIADLYVAALQAKGFDYESGVIKNPHLLHNEVKFYLSYMKENEYEPYDEELAKMKEKMERDFFANNGYGYTDRYDDLDSSDDLQSEFDDMFNNKGNRSL